MTIDSIRKVQLVLNQALISHSLPDSRLTQNQSTNIIFGDINSNNNNLNIKNLDPICILIGPEGDFTARERNSILKLKNIIPIKINENILRSETAAISITSIISFKMLS